MKYIVVLPAKVQKELARVDERYAVRVRTALVAIGSNPMLGKKLSGELKNQRSYDVWPYRIVYEVDGKKLIVLVIRVGHRQGVYSV